jgi:hypothetical protein
LLGSQPLANVLVQLTDWVAKENGQLLKAQ